MHKQIEKQRNLLRMSNSKWQREADKMAYELHMPVKSDAVKLTEG